MSCMRNTAARGARKAYKNKFIKRVKKYRAKYKEEEFHCFDEADIAYVKDKRTIDYGDKIWMDRFFLNGDSITPIDKDKTV